MNWIFWALLSALFAGITAVLAKVGVANVDSNLATAVRTTVVLVFTWLIVLVVHRRLLRQAERLDRDVGVIRLARQLLGQPLDVSLRE